MRISVKLGGVFLGICLIAVGAFAISAKAHAQDADKDKKKDEGLPLKPTRKISFTTDEGTWMSLDVSPDGRQIVFDLLGDLYLLPIEGGEAKRITSGMPWDCQPRFSPDGKQIAFISDRSGSDNIWLINVDGSDPKVVTHETDHNLGSPAWSPDGQYLIARRWGPYPKNDSYIGSDMIWIYHRDGGSGIELKKTGIAQFSGMAFSPDGKKLYYSSGHSSYADKNGDIGRFQVAVLDRETGEESTITSHYGGGLRPIISPNGQYLVYASRHDTKTGLIIRDLKSNEEHWLSNGMQRDDQEGTLADDILPGYAFTPDSQSVVYPDEGHIKRVNVATHQVTTIPFTAKVEQDLGPRVRTEYKIDDGPLAVRQMRWVNQAPDGKWVFSAVGKIWTVDAQGGTPRRLTSGSEREYEPTFSPDGRWVAYVTWTNAEGGALWKVSSSGGEPSKITQDQGFYSEPSWSPDGNKILVLAGSWQDRLQGRPDGTQLQWISADGGKGHTILNAPVHDARFNNDATRVFFTDGDFAAGEASMVLRSVRTDGLDKKTHLRFEMSYPGGIVIPSPDEKWVLVNDRYDAYVMPFPVSGSNTDVRIGLTGGAVTVKRLTKTGANYLHWADGGKTITWGYANEFHRAKLDDIWKAEKDDDWKAETTTVNLTVPRDMPQGKFLLRNARLITMKGQEIIERGDILVENNRIKEVGATGSLHPSANAKVIDLRGKTVMPGFVDIHSHTFGVPDILFDQSAGLAANLAYGVTTTRDPSIESNGIFWESELVTTGELVGPRRYSTGTAIVVDAATINSFEDADNVVKRYKGIGADSLKQYMQPRRIQRQWMAMAAAKEGMNITAEGALDLKLDLSMVMDGYTGVEHALPIAPVYKDVMEFEAQAGTTYTPTLVVSYGSEFSEFYWRQRMNIHDDPKVMRFTPHEEVDTKARRRPLLFDEDYIFPLTAKGAAGIVARGGHVALGSHGEQQGIGAQWELWMLQSGGMTPWQALWCATMNGAESIGLDKEIGSLEPGKMADMIVLNANPLDSIQNTNKIQYVIKNGVIYDGDTLDEIWPKEKKFPAFPWKQTDAELQALPR
jgi:Tol biopolymer transport system component/imidazolonepropionase-like amidohydrolase